MEQYIIDAIVCNLNYPIKIFSHKTMYTEENMNEIKIGPKLTFDRQILLNNTWRFINCTQRAYV